MYSCKAKESLNIEILQCWHSLLEKWFINICIDHTLKIAVLGNRCQQLTAMFAKCNLLKWNTLYTQYNLTQCTIYIFFLVGSFREDSKFYKYYRKVVPVTFNGPACAISKKTVVTAVTWAGPGKAIQALHLHSFAAKMYGENENN